MIARIWCGAVRPEDATQYVAYVEETGIRNYRETPGNLGAHILRRDIEDRTEIVTLTFWESMDAVRAFAGDAPELARYYPQDDHYLIEKPEHVEHYDAPYTSNTPGVLPPR